MKQLELLQTRINELDSAILNFKENKVYITGFYNDSQLMSHLNNGVENWSSKGIYDLRSVNFNSIRSNALFIILENGVTVSKYQFKVLLKRLVSNRNKKGKITITIRKNIFGEDYGILTEEKDYSFANKFELESFLLKEYKDEILID